MNIKGIAKNHSLLAKIFEWIGICIISTFCSILLWQMIFGSNDITSLKWLQLLQSISLFLIPSIFCAFLWSDQPADFLCITKAPSWKDICFAMGIIIVGLPAINMLSNLNQQLVLPDFLKDLEIYIKEMETSAEALTEQFVKADNIGQLTINILLMALTPALCEEFCFRGTMQNVLNEKSKNKNINVWVVAFIFSFIHFQFYGFLPRLLLGAFLGYLLVWTKSIWVPIIAHFTNNACSVIAYYIVSKKSSINIDDIDSLGSGDTLWVGILSCFCIGLGIYFYLHIKKSAE